MNGSSGTEAKEKKTRRAYPALWFVGILFGLQVLIILIFREGSYVQVHDNLDLFVPHFRMMRLNNGFHAKNALMPMLHGVNRDLLGSEFQLYPLLFNLLPTSMAYFAGYLLKILVGFGSFILLSREMLGKRFRRYRAIIIPVAAAYGMLPVFPAYGIAFTSVPLIIWLLLRLYRAKTPKEQLFLYIGIFCYPLLSYFSYHGFFILAYMVAAILIIWPVKTKFPFRILIATCILALGYMAWEYRLFGAMLFDDTVTIRSSMVHAQASAPEALGYAVSEFFMASFHSQDDHTYFILPIVLIGLVLINAGHIRNRKAKRILTEPVNLLLGWIIFNCLIFGFYQNAAFRGLVETIVPKLTGFEFARTAYFNTFLWYAELLLVLMRLFDLGKKPLKKLACAAACIAALIVMFVPQVYNDFYSTCYNYAYQFIKKKESSGLNYREFYSEALFGQIKNDLNYQGEWAAAYGLHPGVLIYNGISTVDGYLGMYPQSYKETWREVISPALENSPSLREYFDNWGARVCLYSGSDENTYAPLRELKLEDPRLCADTSKLRELECRYIFSRIEFSNAYAEGLTLVGCFSGYDSPYTIYVYSL
ncbi:MAG: DUF6044 family protein [Lachnospiraceae bacterium]|nr:DUF6044 family protein [Lachnospiraceae bacterium]